MMNVSLIKLTKEYYNQISEVIDEWKLDQEINHTNHSPWAIFKNDYHDFDYYLEHLEVKEAKDGKVPDSVFYLLDNDRNILLGAVNIRHYLNDYLLKYAGHIGDGIRPSERGKGYGTLLMNKAKEIAEKEHAKRIALNVFDFNKGAIKLYKNLGYSEQRYTLEMFLED